MVILKLDFEKPFDKVEHQVILQNLVKVFHKVDWVDISNFISWNFSSVVKWNSWKVFSLQKRCEAG
jgi:hypothetical protein